LNEGENLLISICRSKLQRRDHLPGLKKYRYAGIDFINDLVLVLINDSAVSSPSVLETEIHLFNGQLI